MALRHLSLDDKYVLDSGHIFVTGIQALVRLPMLQAGRDRAAGHRTACYISGYRGSPLGGLDMQLERARSFLDQHNIVFVPGVNEDLAATALWGAQQAELDGEGRFDGVFGMWYGKGPGVDRSGDALRHANLAGVSPLGGVLALMGDDHTCESSTTCHQSEYAMMDAMIPVLNPAGVQDIVDYGLYGWAMSRYSGCWAGLKCVHDTVEASASISIADERVRVVLPEDFAMPEGGLNIRWPDTPQQQERRLHEHKLEAVKAFARVNDLDRVVVDGEQDRIGIITTGKSFLDVRQALAELGIDDRRARALGLRVYKLALSFPLEPAGIRRFAEGLERIIVVEEKRPLIEDQLKSLLYNEPAAPRVAGKHDLDGRPMFPSAGRLDSNRIALAVGRQLLELNPVPDAVHDSVRDLRRDFAVLEQRLAQQRRHESGSPPMVRAPYFCAGCPHNTSTVVPEGSRARAGIGCHFMALWMDRGTDRFTHMGAEGANWVGEALFSKRKHIFQNVGDGTYFHSGLLAIRAAVAAGVNITFKVLYNDAVAMTGGQAMDGPLSPQRISRQLHAEGVRRIAVVTDEPHKYDSSESWAPDVTVHHRRKLQQVQTVLREAEGVTALIYDQTCAAEKRRRRKRGAFPDPVRRVFINQAVCEGCGDCGVQSNCVAILPSETEFGRKRSIDQSACNKDYSCLDGFCPSFVTVIGGALRKHDSAEDNGNGNTEAAWPPLPAPALPEFERAWRIVLAGVGGTGVVTIGALLGMAAHLMGRGCSVLDMMGLAQKGGAVMSHVIIGHRPEDLSATHIPSGGADLLLGFDMVVAAGPALEKAGPERTRSLINRFRVMPGDFTRNPDQVFPEAGLLERIRNRTGDGLMEQINANHLAYALLGDSIGANLMMLGYACQKGWIPLSVEALERAIELNGQAVEMNLKALNWGRRAAVDLPGVERRARAAAAATAELDAAERLSTSTGEIIERRVTYLRAYQDRAYAERYRKRVEAVIEAEKQKAGEGRDALGLAAARNYFQLLAYKDEYEVARLFSNGDFQRRLAREFEGGYRLRFHLAPPLSGGRDPLTGRPRKREFGAWMMTVFRVLAKCKGLRGTPFDPFGYSAERKRERQLTRDYEQTLDALLDNLNPDNHATAVAIANIPQSIRGFGPVKEAAMAEARVRQEALMAEFGGGGVREAA